MMKDSPIGVFDSGLGGLTCVKRLLRLVPCENIIFFADTKRNPYGVKTKEQIIECTNDDVAFLQRHGAKIIIAACGTVSSNVTKEDIKCLNVPYVDVITPTVSAALNTTKTKRVGIVGTEATIKSGSFSKMLKEADGNIFTISAPCQNLVALVEAGKIDENDPDTNKAVKEYLQPIKEACVDTLILGCTHFPLISKIIQNTIGQNVQLIDAGAQAAKAAAELLNECGTAGTGHGAFTKYFVSGDNVKFDKVANIFLEGADNVKSVAADVYK
jgi:glutamate racemase